MQSGRHAQICRATVFRRFSALTAFPGLFYLLCFGQTSGIPLACFTLAYLAIRRNYLLVAGLALGGLIFKPQLGVAAAIIFLAIRSWRIVAGGILSAAFQLGAGWLQYGGEVMGRYFSWILHAHRYPNLLDPYPFQMFSLWGFWSLLFPARPVMTWVLYLISAALALSASIIIWLKQPLLKIRFSALLICSVLVAPHLNVYDLVNLAPAFLLLADWALENSLKQLARILGMLLYLCYVLFLFDTATKVTHVQIGVAAIAALLWSCWKVSAVPRGITLPADTLMGH